MSTTQDTALPVDTLKDAAPFLRRPFTAQAVKFKVQATWPKDAPKTGLIVAYIDARAVIERLNAVIPHKWNDPEYNDLGSGVLECVLTVDGITRRDVGSGYQGKGLRSDAFKRAAVKFGVGVSLYAIPKITIHAGQGLDPRRVAGKATLVLNQDGEKRARAMYSTWLGGAGTEAFGPALDHGDAEDAVGDVDADYEPIDVAETPADGVLPDSSLRKLRAAYKASGKDVEWLRMQMVAAGVTDASDVRAAMKSLTAEQGVALMEALS